MLPKVVVMLGLKLPQQPRWRKKVNGDVVLRPKLMNILFVIGINIAVLMAAETT